MPGQVTEPVDIDRTKLFDKNTSRRPLNHYLGPERCWLGARGSRSNNTTDRGWNASGSKCYLPVVKSTIRTTWIHMTAIAVLLLASCSLGGGTEDARWWIDRGVSIEPSTTSFEVRVGWVSCVNTQVQPEDIEGYTVTYDEESVAVSIEVRLPGGFVRTGGCSSLGGGEPVITIELDEPLGNRTLMVRRGTEPPREAIVYNF